MTSIKAELINYMGNDLDVVNAARVSFDKESDWDISYDDFDTELVLPDKDRKLIHYLSRNNHWTPFSHCQITLRETVPIFIARQRFKHMVGFTYNEISRRYVDGDPEFFEPEHWRKKAENKKQGSSDEDLDMEVSLHFNLEGWHKECLRNYKLLLDIGVAPEEARMVLPQSMMTSYYVTGSLAAFARAYSLRIDSHAQKEIQELAAQWDMIIRPLFPVSWAALVDKDKNV